jgi:hypothetical protein
VDHLSVRIVVIRGIPGAVPGAVPVRAVVGIISKANAIIGIPGIAMEGKRIIIPEGIKVVVRMVGIPLIHPIGSALEGRAFLCGILLHLILGSSISLFALRWRRLVQFVCHPSGLNGGTGTDKQGNYQGQKQMFRFHGMVLLL